jgi:hypothetical protein
MEKLETDIRQVLPDVTVFTHLESLNDPASWDDAALDRIETPLVDELSKHRQPPSVGDDHIHRKSKP